MSRQSRRQEKLVRRLAMFRGALAPALEPGERLELVLTGMASTRPFSREFGRFQWLALTDRNLILLEQDSTRSRLVESLKVARAGARLERRAFSLLLDGRRIMKLRVYSRRNARAATRLLAAPSPKRP